MEFKETKSCMNCKHKWQSICVLFDELIEDNCYCFMHDSR